MICRNFSNGISKCHKLRYLPFVFDLGEFEICHSAEWRVIFWSYDLMHISSMLQFWIESYFTLPFNFYMAKASLILLSDVMPVMTSDDGVYIARNLCTFLNNKIE